MDVGILGKSGLSYREGIALCQVQEEKSASEICRRSFDSVLRQCQPYPYGSSGYMVISKAYHRAGKGFSPSSKSETCSAIQF